MPSQPALRPDGSVVVYVLRTLDAERDRNVCRLWQVPTDGSAVPTALTDGPHDLAPAWSPDGGALALLRPGAAPDGSSAPQIWLHTPESGALRQLTDLPLGAGTPVWSPDGSGIAFSAEVAPAPLPPATAPRVVDRTDYSSDGRGLRLGVRSQLHVVDVATGATRQLTALGWDAGAPCWSPDGSRLAFIGDPTPQAAFRLTTSAFTIRVDGDDPTETVRRVASADAHITALAWEPDGTTLLAVGRAEAGVGHDGLLRLSEDGSATIPLDDPRAPAVGGGEWAGAAPVFADTGELIVGMADASRFPLVAIDLQAAAVRELIATDTGIVVGCSGPHAGRLAVVLADQDGYGEVMIVDPADPPNRRTLTSLTADAMHDVRIERPQRRRFSAPDGSDVHGWLLRRPELSGPLPLLLDVHGGPHLCWPGALQQANPYHQVLVAAGWNVLLVDPRGSEGYGEEFYTGNLGRWGREDADDLLAAVDQLVDDGLADPGRMAVCGYSYGGFMTMQLTTRTDRFAAAIAAGGVCNLISATGTDDIDTGISLFEFGVDPYADPRTVLFDSPISRVREVRTPTLLLHAEDDRRCPISQSEEWLAGLRWHGVTAQLVRYPQASHQFLVDGRPSHRIDYNRRIVDWATRWTAY